MQLIQMVENELLQFLKGRFSAYGSAALFSRRTGIKESAISKWLRGQVPSFENCLRIAVYFKLDPYTVFEWTGRSDYSDLARGLGVEGGQPSSLSEQDLYPDPRHQEIHRSVHELLEVGRESDVERFISGLHHRYVGFWQGLDPMVDKLGASAGVIAARGRVLYETGDQVTDSEKSVMRELGDVRGWKALRREPEEGFKEIAVYFKKIKEIPSAMDLALQVAMDNWSNHLRFLDESSEGTA